MKYVTTHLACLFALAAIPCTRVEAASNQVVVYTSVDEGIARPVAELFERETGIRVRLVPKTKGSSLLSRLVVEKNRPQADVFWSGDPVRAAFLKTKGVSAPYRSPNAETLPDRFSDPAGHWTGFSARARVLIYNRNLVPSGDEPTSIFDLLEKRFSGKACIANPLHGTTSMHAAALFLVLGETRAKDFFERFAANGGTILPSNAEVRRGVSSGRFALGLTDTDDANAALEEGKPVGVVYPDETDIGTLIIPSCAVLIAAGPNPAAGRRFINYLLCPETETALAMGQAAQIPLRPGLQVPDQVTPLAALKTMDADYTVLGILLEDLAEGYLKEWVERNK